MDPTETGKISTASNLASQIQGTQNAQKEHSAGQQGAQEFPKPTSQPQRIYPRSTCGWLFGQPPGIYPHL